MIITIIALSNANRESVVKYDLGLTPKMESQP
jgi:hypothetical protein